MHTDASDEPGMGLAAPAAHATHDEASEAPVAPLYVPAGHGVYVCRTEAAATAEQ